MSRNVSYFREAHVYCNVPERPRRGFDYREAQDVLEEIRRGRKDACGFNEARALVCGLQVMYQEEEA